MKLALFLVGAFIAPTFGAYFGSVNVDGHGEVYVVGSPLTDSSHVQVSSNELRLNGGSWGSRVYFASKPSNDFSEDMWWKVSNKSLTTILKSPFLFNQCKRFLWMAITSATLLMSAKWVVSVFLKPSSPRWVHTLAMMGTTIVILMLAMVCTALRMKLGKVTSIAWLLLCTTVLVMVNGGIIVTWVAV